MRFRYRYEHLDCTLCDDMAEAGCPHVLCPHIMENLDDLRRDRAFIEAVEDADETLSYHTPTLIFLNSIGFPDTAAMRLPPEYSPAPAPYHHGVKPECAGCPYPRAGLFCHSADGAWTKTDYAATLERSRIPCRA